MEDLRLSVAVVIVDDMRTRNRRLRDKRRAAARERKIARNDMAARGGGELRPVRFAYELNCPRCGYSIADEMVAPSSAPIGAQVDISTSCSCGARTHGTARVHDVLASPD